MPEYKSSRSQIPPQSYPKHRSDMHWLSKICLAATGAALELAQQQQVAFAGSFTPSTEIKSTNLTDMVQWDGYSLLVKGQRITLWSGEVHRMSALMLFATW